ncbi:MAG: phosphate signaling complex protein PhoU [Leptospiraceae bacterium]|nr:phosphate signaling complex protein PhoU [Leptospiraceae bacterium]MDW7975090.1 phosphate signaling complex protein PhoU [Leptospiraceae bacterium]
MIRKEIEKLKEMIHLMCRKTETMYFTSLEVLRKKDRKLLNELLEMDKDLNKMEVDVDNACLNLLALKDPYAVDFRYIISVMKSTRDLERIGDESKTIGKWSFKSDLEIDRNSDFQSLVNYTTEALQKAIQALTYEDLKFANDCLQLELNVDELEEKILSKDPILPSGLIIRAMERIGDLSANIAENVIYYLEAKDIRHQV